MRFRHFCFLLSVLVLTGQDSLANTDCQTLHAPEGLIFDAGAFVADQNMEIYLDEALLKGVAKVALFPHPDSSPHNRPSVLEEIFPDLVLQGARPWSKAPGVVWPEPLGPDTLDQLASDLARHPERNFLLSGLMRFESTDIKRLLLRHPNLWVGLDHDSLKALDESCASGALREVIDTAHNRTVFASFGETQNWKAYKYILRRLNKTMALLGKDQADAILFKNAEQLYQVAVNAP